MSFGAGILAGTWLSSRVVIRFGARWPLVVSFLISAAGLLLLSGVTADSGYAVAVLPGMLAASIGCGLSLPVLAGAGGVGECHPSATNP